MTGKRSSKCVVAFVVCTTCWMVAWPTRCFMPQRHFVSNPLRVRIIRQAESAEEGATNAEPQTEGTEQGSNQLLELPIGVDDFDQLQAALPRSPKAIREDIVARHHPLHFHEEWRGEGSDKPQATKNTDLYCTFLDAIMDAIFHELDITKSKEGKELLQQELPVVFLKLNGCVATRGVDALEAEINDMLIKEAQRNGVYGIQPLEKRVGATLETVIDAIRDKCDNKRVVFLVDEYDAPITQEHTR
eukprot:1690328-Amphidinium_carterae.1